jgi:hypothetical protein
LCAGARSAAAERRLQAGLTIAGAALVAVGFVTAARPSIYSSSSFWTSSPTWFAIRLGVMMIVLAALKACTTGATTSDSVVRPFRAAHDALNAVARMGRHSLFIYWIHVELVYGYASWLWRGRLPLWAALTACAAFSVLMYGAVVLRDRVTAAWRTRQTAAQPATA